MLSLPFAGARSPPPASAPLRRRTLSYAGERSPPPGADGDPRRGHVHGYVQAPGTVGAAVRAPPCVCVRGGGEETIAPATASGYELKATS